MIEEKLQVLVVDDEVILCQSVEKILKRKGHAIDAATSVADALKIISPDIGALVHSVSSSWTFTF